MTHTITSDEVRCPKCYSCDTHKCDDVYAMAVCDCGCKFEWDVVELVTCTEVPND